MSDQDSVPAGNLEADVIQDEAPATLPLPPVPIVAAETVPVRMVAARHGGSRNFTLTAGQPIRVANYNPRRRRVLVWATEDIFISFGEAGQASCQRGIAALWRQVIGACPITNQEDVWVMLTTTPAGVAPFFVNVITEDAAD